jgi:hypothetical protein
LISQLLFEIILEILSSAVRYEKKVTSIYTGKKNKIISLLCWNKSTCEVSIYHEIVFQFNRERMVYLINGTSHLENNNTKSHLTPQTKSNSRSNRTNE